MANMWEQVVIEMDAVNSREKPIHLTNVPAVRNKETGKIRVDPEEVAKAEVTQLAQQSGFEEGRKLAIAMMLYANPRHFETGKIRNSYAMNKMLFYQWKYMEKQGLGEAFPHDTFIAKRRGPVPEHIEEDLGQLGKQGIVSLSYKKWGRGSSDEALEIELTTSGRKIMDKLWYDTPSPLQEATVEAKGKIFALDPKAVRELVHKEYPEYRTTYTEEDTS